MNTLKEMHEIMSRMVDNSDAPHIFVIEGPLALQIYSNKRQMNIMINELSMINITFDLEENDVEVFRCRNGCCDYSRPIYSLPMNASPYELNINTEILDYLAQR